MNNAVTMVAKWITHVPNPPAPFPTQVKSSVQEIASRHQDRPVHDHNLDALQDSAIDVKSKTLWYFAFGSNLSPAVFEARRKIDPLQAWPAVVKGYELVFDLPGFPPFEPSFANLSACEHKLPDGEECHSCVVHGVVYRISEEALDHLHMTEGGPENYKLEQVFAYPYLPGQGDFDESTGNIPSFTLVAPPSRTLGKHRVETFKPSERYLKILQTGARHHRLSPSWIKRLDSLQASSYTFLTKVVLLAFIVLLMGPFIAGIIATNFILRFVATQAQAKKFRTMSTRLLRKFSWGIVDLFHAISGQGYGEKKNTDQNEVFS